MESLPYITRIEFDNALKRIEDRHGADIKELRDKMSSVSGDIIELKTIMKSLEGMPTLIQDLTITLTRIDNRICNLETGITSLTQHNAGQDAVIQGQEAKIATVDEKTKIDWSQAVSSNWWKILLALGGIYLAMKSAGVLP